MVKAIFEYQKKSSGLYVFKNEEMDYRLAIEISHPRVRGLQFSTSSTWEIEFEPSPDPVWGNLYLGNVNENTGEEQIIKGNLGTVKERERERQKWQWQAKTSQFFLRFRPILRKREY